MHPNSGNYVPPPNPGNVAPPPNPGYGAPPPNPGFGHGVPPPNPGFGAPPPNPGFGHNAPQYGQHTHMHSQGGAQYNQSAQGNQPNNYRIPGYTPEQNPFTYGEYSYRDMSFNNYQVKNYGVNQSLIQTHAQTSFNKFDFGKKNHLTPHELSLAVTDFTVTNQLPDLNYQDLQYLLQTFDYDRNGKTDFNEFKLILEALGGRKFTQNDVKNARQYHGNVGSFQY